MGTPLCFTTIKQILKEGLSVNHRQMCIFSTVLVAGVLLVFCKYWMGTFRTRLFQDDTKMTPLCTTQLYQNHPKSPWAFVSYVSGESLSVGWIRNMNQCCGKCIRAIKRCPSSHKQTEKLCKAPANLMTDFPGTAESSGCRLRLDANAAWHLHPCLNNPCYPEWANAKAN